MNPTTDANQVQPYSFGVSSRLTTEKVALYQEAAREIAKRVTAVVKEWVPGFIVEAAPLVEADAGEDTADGSEAFDEVAILEHAVPGGIIRTEQGLALSLVNALLGGGTLPVGVARPLTSIEKRVIDLLLAPIVEEAADVLMLQSVSIARNLNDRFVAVKDDEPEAVIGFVMNFTAPVGGGRLIVELELSALEPFSDAIDRRLSGRRLSSPAKQHPETASALQTVPIPMSVDLGRIPLSAGEVVGLQPGDVLRIRQPVNEPLTASVGQQALFLVRMGRRGSGLVAEVLASLGSPGAIFSDSTVDLSSNPLLSSSQP